MPAETASPAIRAVVFDLDGLMFNTEDIFNEVGREVCRRRGKEMTRELLQQMMGRRAPEAIGVMIDFHGLSDTVESLIDESRTLFFELAGDRLAPMPGLFELLGHIESRGLRKGVATSSGRMYLEAILRRFDLLERFDFTLAAEDVTHGKPHPEIYLTAAARLGIAPGEMLVLEDSHAGSTAGVTAGAVVISVPNDHSRYQDFSHTSAVATRLDDACVLQLL
ncbi:MAG TPA: HAD family phosphatase [Planctomycetaceae bacterium]|nr:HAD family phosphatase [Planctomycetaceae bacterium]